MALGDGDASWRGIEMGASNAHGIYWSTLAGLTDVPRLGADAAPPARLRDTAVPGWADVGWRDINALNLTVVDRADDGSGSVTADEQIAELVAAMYDRHTIDPLYFVDLALHDDELCVFAVADRCEYLRDAASHVNRAYAPSLRWLAADPTIYSADPTVVTESTPASEHEITVTNPGRWASPSGRAWTLTVTASGAVSSPYVENETTGQRVTWQGLNMTNGQVLVLDEFRSSRIGALGLDGFPRSGTSVAPDWPIIQPGANSFVVGAGSGNVTCVLTYRGTW